MRENFHPESCHVRRGDNGAERRTSQLVVGDKCNVLVEEEAYTTEIVAAILNSCL